MIWDKNVSFENFENIINKWYSDKDFELCHPSIDAQFALDLIFKTLIDDKKNYEYLTSISESQEQVNSIMLHLILWNYSRKYRKFKNKKRKGR